MASTIASKSAIAVQAGKEAVNAAYETSLAQGLNYERRLFHSLFATKDQKEGAYGSRRSVLNCTDALAKAWVLSRRRGSPSGLIRKGVALATNGNKRLKSCTLAMDKSKYDRILDSICRATRDNDDQRGFLLTRSSKPHSPLFFSVCFGGGGSDSTHSAGVSVSNGSLFFLSASSCSG